MVLIRSLKSTSFCHYDYLVSSYIIEKNVQFFISESSAMTNESELIEDLPRGPLDFYRKQASFDWKKMKLFFEDPELLKIKVSTAQKSGFSY